MYRIEYVVKSMEVQTVYTYLKMHSRYHLILMLVQLSLFSKEQFTVKSWQKTSLKQVMSAEIQSCWVARNFPWKKREEVAESRAHSFACLLTYFPFPPAPLQGVKSFLWWNDLMAHIFHDSLKLKRGLLFHFLLNFCWPSSFIFLFKNSPKLQKIENLICKFLS